MLLENYEGLKLIAVGMEKRGIEIRMYLDGEEAGGLPEDCHVSDRLAVVSLSGYITKEKSKFLVEAQYSFGCIEFVVSRSRKGGIFRQLAVWL